jgi:diguanylate cyclase
MNIETKKSGQQQRRATPTASAMAKIAGFMQRMNIECTPANFELIFAVLSGENDELRQEFSQLSKNITQQDLDPLIRKHISHHMEDDIASESIETVGDELNEFIELVQSESNSLEKFDQVIKQQTQTLADPKNVSPEKLKSTLSTITAATQQKMEEGKKVREAVSAQARRLDGVAQGLSDFKQQKFMDALTGLPNRRAFNKELLTIYKGERARNCSLLVIDIDAHTNIKENLGSLIADKFVVHIGAIIEQVCQDSDFLARSGDTQFSVLFWNINDQTAKSIADKAKAITAKTPLLNASNGQPIGSVTISGGICGSNIATSTGELMSRAEAALSMSKSKNGNQVTVFEERRTGDTDLERASYSFYEAS